MADFVDGASVAVAEDLELLEVGSGDGGGRGGGGGSGHGDGRREWGREAGTAFGGRGEGETEIELTAVTDNGHRITCAGVVQDKIGRRREVERCRGGE